MTRWSREPVQLNYAAIRKAERAVGDILEAERQARIAARDARLAAQHTDDDDDQPPPAPTRPDLGEPHPNPTLDWRDRSHWGYTAKRCIHCRGYTPLRDSQDRPSHKVCAEHQTAAT